MKEKALEQELAVWIEGLKAEAIINFVFDNLLKSPLIQGKESLRKNKDFLNISNRINSFIKQVEMLNELKDRMEQEQLEIEKNIKSMEIAIPKAKTQEEKDKLSREVQKYLELLQQSEETTRGGMDILASSEIPLEKRLYKEINHLFQKYNLKIEDIEVE